MMRGDMVSLAAVKAWLNITSSNDDQLLSTLITQISRAVYNTLNRTDILPHTTTEYYDGNNKTQILLRDWPVNTINSLIVGETTIPKATPPGPGLTPSVGWMLDQADEQPPGSMQKVTLNGYLFYKGQLNIYINYDAGYKITDDPYTIPAANMYEIYPSHSYGSWGCDVGVKFASSGVSLTSVSSAPAAGEYRVSDSGTYMFNSADAGKAVLITYGFIPAALEQCALEWIADRYKTRERIGMSSKSLGGQETISYVVKNMPDFVKSALTNFTRIVAN